jgi:hypothetical protein
MRGSLESNEYLYSVGHFKVMSAGRESEREKQGSDKIRPFVFKLCCRLYISGRLSGLYAVRYMFLSSRLLSYRSLKPTN